MPPHGKQTHLFGPVPSRRLGRSLGVDLVPLKTCTFDCVYCQLGRTTHLTAARQAFVSPQDVLDEVRLRLAEADRPDFVTLSGSGEPTLCTELEHIIRGIKSMTDVPVAVLTNGSLLWDSAVRESLLEADLVVPSLDAGDEKLYRYINRPCAGLDFQQVVEGLVAFRQTYSKMLWLEVFLLAGVNSTAADVQRIAALAERIAPDKVQLNTVARPPAEAYAMAVGPPQLQKLSALFPCPTEVVANTRQAHREPAFAKTREEVLTLLRRRPCTLADIAAGLGIHRNEATKHTGELLREGEIRLHRASGENYYQTIQETAS